MSWWYMQNLKHEKEAKELKKKLKQMEEEQQEREYQAFVKKFNEYDFSLDESMMETWREVGAYVAIIRKDDSCSLSFEWMADEPDENRKDVYIVEEKFFDFTQEEIEDDLDLDGLNMEKINEMYNWFGADIGLTIPFSLEDFCIYMRKEFNEYSDTIYW